ncbi:MAG: HsdR family type I site-specific deoxyribonuclease [Candidatus Omnitrophica bacterium]|nr:HsdR family type I site-specific deoxyribonuclease [Candidatus Omnitrophota bacterium]
MLSERLLIEEEVINKLITAGWQYVEPERLNRVSEDEPLLISDLKRKILEINKDYALTEKDVSEVVKRLQNTLTNQEGHKEILWYFKYGVPIKTEKDKISAEIMLFDYNNIKNNDFVFTNQFRFLGKETIRLDILLFINGIPVCNIECKNPYTNKGDYLSAYRQIKRYESIAPELYKYIQVGIGYAEVVKYFPIVPFSDNVKQEIWKKEGLDIYDAIFDFLAPGLFLDILRNFLFIKEFRGEMTKIIGRYMQVRAVNKIYQRVIDNLEGRDNKNKGLIWHWQGSGKTLTMFFACHKLYIDERLKKPTIFFVVDRRDLEDQFKEELSFLKSKVDFEKIESIEKLEEIISYDNFSGKRGVFLTLLHKFNLRELDGFLNRDLKISQRKNIILFLDEVHRNQYGILKSKMKSILKNAFYFGFTGTPIAIGERNTYKEFGYPIEEEKYLDKYFIDEAIEDGFIVPIVYQARKEQDVHLKDEDLEWYLEKVDVDDIGDEAELRYVRKKIKERINLITLFLENKKRIEIICEDIKNHFCENFDGKFKGLIVCGSRKACVYYKRIIDKYLPKEYTEVMMSYNISDEEEILEYKRELYQRYGISDWEEINKIIKNRYKKEALPKLLIVTDMLLTGFDEEKLIVIYLDKMIKRHRLLQAISRTNRPYYQSDENVKPAGLIIDYVGVLKHIEKALKFYLEEDKKGIIKNITTTEEKLKKFIEILERLKEIFGTLVGKFDRESFNSALKILKEEDKEKEFLELYLPLRKLFEFLGATSEKVEYLMEYKWCTGLYEYYKKLMKPQIDESKLENYYKKTINLLHDLIEIKPLIEITKPALLDVDYLERIKNSELREDEKAIALLSGLEYLVAIYGDRNPIYKSIAQKVRELVKLWRERKIDEKTLYHQEIIKVLDLIKEKEEDRRKSNLNNLEYGIMLFLEREIKEEKEKIIKMAKDLYSKIKDSLFKEWQKNPTIRKEVEKKTREFLADIRVKYNLEYEKFNRLHKEIFEYLYDNG